MIAVAICFQINMWDNFNKTFIEEAKKRKPTEDEPGLPEWLNKYIEYKFNLLDRTGTSPTNYIRIIQIMNNE